MQPSEAQTLSRYNLWANQVLCRSLADLPEEELTRPRPSLFKNILHTLNHIYVINQIWRAHLLAEPHGYSARNTDTYPDLAGLQKLVQETDQWYVDWAQTITESALNTMLSFELIGGRPGSMTSAEILLHVMSHASYHRGYIADMLFQIPGRRAPQMDLTIFFGYERGQLR